MRAVFTPIEPCRYGAKCKKPATCRFSHPTQMKPQLPLSRLDKLGIHKDLQKLYLGPTEEYKWTPMPTDKTFKRLVEKRIISSECGYCPDAGQLFRPKKVSLEAMFAFCQLGDKYPDLEIKKLEATIPKSHGLFNDLSIEHDGTVVKLLPAEIVDIEQSMRSRLIAIKTKQIIDRVMDELKVKEVTDQYLHSVSQVGGHHIGIFQDFPSEFKFVKSISQSYIRSPNPHFSGMTDLIPFDFPTDPKVYLGIAYYYPDAEFGIPTQRHAHGN